MDIDKLISTIKQQTLNLNVYLINQKQSLDKYGVQFRQLILFNTKEHLNKLIDSLEKTQPQYKIPIPIRPTNDLINSPITRRLDYKLKISDKLVNTNLENAFNLINSKSNSSTKLSLFKYDSNYKLDKLVEIESKNIEENERDSKHKKEIDLLDAKLKNLELELDQRNEHIENLCNELTMLKTESELIMANEREKTDFFKYSLQNELNRTRIKCESLADKNAQMEEKLEKQTSEFDQLVNELDLERKMCANAKSQAKCLEERVVQMEAQFEKNNSNTFRLNEQLQMRIERESQLEKELMKVNEESNQEKLELITKLKCLEETQAQQEEQVKSLKLLNEQLKSELINLKDLNLKLEEDFNVKHNELEAKLEKKDQQIQSLTSELQSEKFKTTDLDSRVRELQNQLSQSSLLSDSVSNMSDVTMLETALEEAKTNLETLAQKNAELEMLNKKKETQIRDLTDNLDQLSSSIELGKRNYTKLNLLNENELNKETSSRLDNETCADKTNLMSELLAKNEIYEKTNNDLETLIKQLKNDLEQTRGSNCERIRFLEAIKDENVRVIERLEVQICDKDAQMCQLKTRNNTLDGLVSELKVSLDAQEKLNTKLLNDDLSTKNLKNLTISDIDNNNQLTNEITQNDFELLTNKCSNLENLLSDKENKLDDLITNNQKLAKENEQLLTSVNSLTTEKEEHKQQVRTSEHKMTNLEFKLKQSENLIDQKDDEIRELNKELAKLEKILSDKEFEIKKITNALIKTNEARVPISLDHKWKEIDQLLDKKEHEFKKLEKKLNESETERARLEKEIDRLSKELDDQVGLNEINSDLLKLSKQEADLNAISKIDLEKAKITIEEENALVKSELNAIRFELEKTRLNDREELLKKCASLESEIKSKDTQIKTLKEKLDDIKLVNEQLNDLQRSLKEQDLIQADREDKLKRKLNVEKEKLVRDLKDASETWLKERAELASKLEQMNRKYKELSDTYVKVGFEKTLLQGDNNKLKEQLSKSESQFNMVKNEMKELKDKLSSDKPSTSTESKLIGLRLKELDNKDLKYAKLESLVKQKQEEINIITKRYDEEHIELGRVNRRAQVLQHDLAEAETEITKEKANKNKIERQKTDLQRKLEEMDRQLEVSANTQATLNDSRMRAEGEVTKLKNEIEELNKKHETSYAQLRSVHEETVREMNERISQLIRTVNKLEKEKTIIGAGSDYSTAVSSSTNSPARMLSPPRVFSSPRIFSPARRFF